MGAYVKKLSDIYSLRNVKFYEYESYNILWEEVYKEKFSYSSKWLFCNENIYIYMYVCMYVIINHQYYIWWLCKKWKKFSLKRFCNIILIRKWRTIIFYEKCINYNYKEYKIMCMKRCSSIWIIIKWNDLIYMHSY